MATKYIQKSKEGKWRVSNTHAEKATRVFDTQKEAIIYTKGLESTKVIMLKGTNGKFRKLSNWDTVGSKNHSKKKSKFFKIKEPSYIVFITIFLVIGIVLGLYFGGMF